MTTQVRRRKITVPAATGLDVIAYELFGDPGNFREIAEVNGLDIFEQLPIGEQIEVPTQEEILAKAKEVIGSNLNDYIDSKLDLSKLKQKNEYLFRLIDWII